MCIRDRAHRADASIFGAGQPSEDDVREYWEIVDGSLKEMTGTVGFWRRQQARFSPRSLLADARAALNSRGAVSARTALNPRAVLNAPAALRERFRGRNASKRGPGHE